MDSTLKGDLEDVVCCAVGLYHTVSVTSPSNTSLKTEHCILHEGFIAETVAACFSQVYLNKQYDN